MKQRNRLGLIAGRGVEIKGDVAYNLFHGPLGLIPFRSADGDVIRALLV